MQRFVHWIADRFRPYHNSGLAPHLRIPLHLANRFQRGTTERNARLSAGHDVPFGIFKLIGLEHAHRAARIWRPRGLLLMEDLSLAFEMIEHQRQRGIIVEEDDIERLVDLLFVFLPFLGVKRPKGDIRALVDGYLAENSLPDAVPANEAQCEITVDHPLLEELRKVDAEIKDRFVPWTSKSHADLGDLGLGLGNEIGPPAYESCSPLNCATFASTGGDGTHFSLIIRDGAIVTGSPVVMTTPANMGKSVILGETLFEFLCLGCSRGFVLDSLSSDDPRNELSRLVFPEWQVGEPPRNWIKSSLDSYQRDLIEYLIDRLNLRPWTDPERFFELQDLYAPMLRLPPDVSRR